MGDLPLRTPTHRRLGGPLPRQLANAPHGHLSPPWISPQPHAGLRVYAVLVAVSRGYPPVTGRSHTCYSPVRRSPSAALLPPRCPSTCMWFFSFFVRPAPLLCGGRPGREPSRPVVFAPSSFGLFPYIKESTWTRRRPCPLAQHRGRPPRYTLVSVISSRSIISMDSSYPLPVGRDCKGNNFFPFRQTTKPGFSAPGTAVPRLRLQRYYPVFQPREPPFPVCGCKGTTKFPFPPNFSTTFFRGFLA